MTDNIVIQSIHPDTKKLVVVVTVEGKSYPKVLPFLTTNDATLLSQQLKDVATELRGEFDDLKAQVEAADANAVPAVSDAVNALVGQPIELDTASTTGDTTTTPPADTTAPADGSTTEAPADGTTPQADTTSAQPADGSTPEDSSTPAA